MNKYNPLCTADPHSDTDWDTAGLLYHALNFFFQRKFGVKVRKLSLDAGFLCPNRDGTSGQGGCIFCDPESFSPSRRLKLPSLTAQIEEGIRHLSPRKEPGKYLAYFQPATNTYAPTERLRQAYEEPLAHPRIVGLAIGTRPDCVSKPVLDLLEEISRKTFLVVEYGLQSIHDRSLRWMNRGHRAAAFFDAFDRTRRRGIHVGAHVILGLPGESPEDMIATARELAGLELHSVKLHNLYAVKNTPLAEMVENGEISLPTFDEHVRRAADFLEHLPPRVVIDRLSGDAPPQYLVGPAWCRDKTAVRRAVEAEFRKRGTKQGSRFENRV
ncbi:MAG: TIGR01212 family radical SAM protein [Pirellulales bacterium]|nr:TIGR01212 family radical SAM protein [Pirellulales bacterium]